MTDIKETAKEAGDAVANLATEAAEKAVEAGHTAIDAVTHVASDVAEKARHGIGDLLHRVGDKLKGK